MKLHTNFSTVLTIASGAALSLAISIGMAGADQSSRAASIAHIFALARTGGAPALLAARKAADAGGDTSLDDVYALALYHADPHAYAADFVSAFPTTSAGVMGDYADAIGDAHLVTPPAYPFTALAQIGATGNERAIAKLVRAYGVSDGATTESISDGIALVSKTQAAPLLDVIAALPAQQRDAIVADSNLWCAADARALGAAHVDADTKATAQRVVQATHACSNSR